MMPSMPSPTPVLTTQQGQRMAQCLATAGYTYTGMNNQGCCVYDHPSGSQVIFVEVPEVAYGNTGQGWVPGTLRLSTGVLASQKINGPTDPLLCRHLQELEQNQVV